MQVTTYTGNQFITIYIRNIQTQLEHEQQSNMNGKKYNNKKLHENI